MPPQDISLLTLHPIIQNAFSVNHRKKIFMLPINVIQVEAFLERMYIHALNKANEKQIDWPQYQNQIQRLIKISKIPFEKIKNYTQYSRNDWIEDLLEITRDLKAARETKSQYRQKLHNRAGMHFSSGHYDNLSKPYTKSSETKKVLTMYKESQVKQWTSQKLPELTDFVLQNTVYILGLTKGNGVIVQQKYLITCAHVFMDEDSNLMRYRCFATGNGSYGIVKVNSNGIFLDKDVGFGKIVKIFQAQRKSQPLNLNVPKSLKFSKQFQPIRCIQVGVLFNNEQESVEIKMFQASQGFIQRNLYQSNADHRLVEEMGLLVHDCYGLWGTSGAPLWTSQGQLLGIHNAWNEDGYNISMIVHDDDTSKCRVIKQYERRAIGVHVLLLLFEEWKNLLQQEQMGYNYEHEALIQELSAKRKKVKA